MGCVEEQCVLVNCVKGQESPAFRKREKNWKREGERRLREVERERTFIEGYYTCLSDRVCSRHMGSPIFGSRIT